MSTATRASTTAGRTAPAAPPRPPWKRIPYRLRARVAVGLLLLALWEVGIRLLAPPYAARPSTVAPVVPEVLTSEQFLTAFAGTMVPIAQGLAIGIALAVLVGLAMGRIRWVEWALRGYTNALFALPMVAVVPLITMWLGYTEASRLAIVIFATYFPMVLSVYDGARAVSGRYLEVAATYRAPRRHVWFGLVLPASIPYLLTGFRLASGRALVGAVVAEYIISIPGLGFYILLNARSFRHPEAFVAVLALAGVGVGIVVAVRWATRRLAPWYAAESR
ncbi:ABC transporter permease [Egicoccus sp. AB-alg6-2]|uniref:ABC transporter permease n=1 Tax=Egicoccus sp. AB-alg6-2 TaxID=3242692 RepID=UPI00359E352A